MVNNEQLWHILRGSENWKRYTKLFPSERIDLAGADLTGADLSGANLCRADLRDAKLNYADLTEAKLDWADLSGAKLINADLREADLSNANLRDTDFREAYLNNAYLRQAYLIGADLREVILHQAYLGTANLRDADLAGADLSYTNLGYADLSYADLSYANLEGSVLVETNLVGTTLTGCRVYGISAWNLKLDGAKQNNLIITKYDEPAISADNLEVAQFIYLLLHNENIRHVIDNITSKVVLILGRFTPERKVVLDAIKGELRKRDYLPVLFDFKGPKTQDITETVSTLAHMARFVIADITDAKSIPAELEHIVPQLPSVAVQPLINKSDKEYGLFNHIQRYPWVLPLYRYENQDELLAVLEEKVISPAEAKANEIRNI